MKVFICSIFFIIAVTGCIRQPNLPVNSPYTVTGILNDSTWYGTGEILRIREPAQRLRDVKQFNLFVYTDIDYPGMSNGQNPNTNTGCVNRECTRTQILMLYDIPLKKGRTTIAKLNRRITLKNEQANLSYLGNSGGLEKRYTDQGLKPSWIRVTKIDKATGIIEGVFTLSLKEDMSVYGRLENGMSKTARLNNGLFRIKIKDVILK